MTTPQLPAGTVHNLPPDLRTALLSTPNAQTAWQNITPLARNEWICWTTSVKNAETRKNHIERVISELQEGKRRPCCWIGCIHRTDKEISPSVRWVLSKQSRST